MGADRTTDQAWTVARDQVRTLYNAMLDAGEDVEPADLRAVARTLQLLKVEVES